MLPPMRRATLPRDERAPQYPDCTSRGPPGWRQVNVLSQLVWREGEAPAELVAPSARQEPRPPSRYPRSGSAPGRRIVHQYVQSAASSRCGSALKLSRVKRFFVNTNSVNEQLRTHQLISMAVRSGAASASRTAVPMTPPEVNTVTRRRDRWP